MPVPAKIKGNQLRCIGESTDKEPQTDVGSRARYSMQFGTAGILSRASGRGDQHIVPLGAAGVLTPGSGRGDQLLRTVRCGL